MSVTLRAYMPGDLDGFRHREEEKETRKLTGATAEQFVENFGRRGPMLTVANEQEVLCIGGIVILTPGVAEPWMIGSEGLAKHPLAFTKIAVEQLARWAKTYGIRRYQAIFPETNPRSKRWLGSKVVGFKQEALMREYFPGVATYLYSRIEVE